MDANTYSDPQVIKLLQAHYCTLKVDQDSHPDLSNRYEDFGWPATVIVDGQGHEIVKRQGYIAPVLQPEAMEYALLKFEIDLENELSAATGSIDLQRKRKEQIDIELSHLVEAIAVQGLPWR